MEMAFAKEAQLLSEDGVMTPADKKDLIASARARVDLTTDRATRRTEFRAAERKMGLLIGINNINQSINQVTQSLSSNLAQTRSAEATRQGADAKKEEEMLDQTKDLFQQETPPRDIAENNFSRCYMCAENGIICAIEKTDEGFG